MRKKSSFFTQTVMLQILWIMIGTVVMFVLFKLIDSLIVGSIDAEAPLSDIYKLYFNIYKYVFIIIGTIILMIGSFVIQKRQFEKYSQYFISGIKYLKGESADIIPFHESLSDERLAFITLRKQQVEMERDYEIAYREKTDLLTYLAHDIKTPLSNLLGYASLLNDEDDLTQEQQRKFIKVIFENAKNLNGLSEDFFSYLKFNLHEIPLNITKVNVEVLFKQWEEERKLSSADSLMAIEFKGTRGKEVKTDPELLLRVMDNLLTNAKKYSVKGTTIYTIVSISDNELKINIINEVEKELNVNWELVRSKFYRGDISRNRLGNKGSGLGLTIVSDIVEHLGGNFEISKTGNKVNAEVTFPTS